jgi:hypothetical protein
MKRRRSRRKEGEPIIRAAVIVKVVMLRLMKIHRLRVAAPPNRRPRLIG